MAFLSCVLIDRFHYKPFGDSYETLEDDWKLVGQINNRIGFRLSKPHTCLRQKYMSETKGNIKSCGIMGTFLDQCFCFEEEK